MDMRNLFCFASLVLSAAIYFQLGCSTIPGTTSNYTYIKDVEVSECVVAIVETRFEGRWDEPWRYETQLIRIDDRLNLEVIPTPLRFSKICKAGEVWLGIPKVGFDGLYASPDLVTWKKVKLTKVFSDSATDSQIEDVKYHKGRTYLITSQKVDDALKWNLFSSEDLEHWEHLHSSDRTLDTFAISDDNLIWHGTFNSIFKLEGDKILEFPFEKNVPVVEYPAQDAIENIYDLNQRFILTTSQLFSDTAEFYWTTEDLIDFSAVLLPGGAYPKLCYQSRNGEQILVTMSLRGLRKPIVEVYNVSNQVPLLIDRLTIERWRAGWIFPFLWNDNLFVMSPNGMYSYEGSELNRVITF